MNRSFLFVPADSERKLAKAGGVGADAIILDLEDAVAVSAKAQARALAYEYLQDQDDVWVRINPLDSADAANDLAAIMPAAPTGIVLPKPRSPTTVVELSNMLDRLESDHGVDAGSTRVLSLCTEHPQALLTLHGYVDATPRLSFLSWGRGRSERCPRRHRQP